MRALILVLSIASAAALLNRQPTTPKTRSVATSGLGSFFSGKVVPVDPVAAPEPEAELVNTVVDVAVLAMRLTTCSLMYHHGIDKIQNVEGFSANVVAKFFGFLPGEPQFWTYSAAATQVAGSGLLAIGVLSRPVAFSMLMTMLVAVIFHLLNTGPEGFPLAVVKQHSYNYELAAMYVAILGYFTAAGAGPYSADEAVLGGELQLYQGILEKLKGGPLED